MNRSVKLLVAAAALLPIGAAALPQTAEAASVIAWDKGVIASGERECPAQAAETQFPVLSNLDELFQKYGLVAARLNKLENCVAEAPAPALSATMISRRARTMSYSESGGPGGPSRLILRSVKTRAYTFRVASKQAIGTESESPPPAPAAPVPAASVFKFRASSASVSATAVGGASDLQEEMNPSLTK